MLLVGFFNGLLCIRFKSLIPPQKLFALRGDPGPPSGEPADLPVKEGKPQPFFHRLDQFPSLAVGHVHLVRSLVQGVRFLHPLQEFIRPFSKSLSAIIKPNFESDFQDTTSTVILG